MMGCRLLLLLLLLLLVVLAYYCCCQAAEAEVHRAAAAQTAEILFRPSPSPPPAAVHYGPYRWRHVHRAAEAARPRRAVSGRPRDFGDPPRYSSRRQNLGKKREFPRIRFRPRRNPGVSPRPVRPSWMPPLHRWWKSGGKPAPPRRFRHRWSWRGPG